MLSGHSLVGRQTQPCWCSLHQRRTFFSRQWTLLSPLPSLFPSFVHKQQTARIPTTVEDGQSFFVLDPEHMQKRHMSVASLSGKCDEARAQFRYLNTGVWLCWGSHKASEITRKSDRRNLGLRENLTLVEWQQEAREIPGATALVLDGTGVHLNCPPGASIQHRATSRQMAIMRIETKNISGLLFALTNTGAFTICLLASCWALGGSLLCTR